MDLTGAVQDQTHAPNFMDPASGRVIAALSFSVYYALYVLLTSANFPNQLPQEAQQLPTSELFISFKSALLKRGFC